MTQPASLPESHPPRAAAPERPPVAVLVLDEEGALREGRRQAGSLLSGTVQESRGRPVEAVLPDPIGEKVGTAVRRAVADGAPVVVEGYHPSVRRWFAVRVRSASNTVTVTFRGRTVRQQYGTLLHLLDATVLEGLWRVAPDGTLQAANAAAARLLGHDDPAEMEGTDVEAFLEDPSAWAVLRGAAGGEPVGCTLRRRDGGRVAVRMRLTAVRDPTGRVQAFDGALRPADTSVVAGRTGLLHRAAAAADEAVAVLTPGPLAPPGPEVVCVNAAFEALTGIPAGEIVGTSLRALYGPKTDPDVLRTLRAHLEKGQPYRGETVLYRGDGTPYVSRWSVAPVRDETGTITYWVATQHDVTKRRDALPTLRARRNPARALYTSLDPLLRAETAAEVAATVVELVRSPLALPRAVVRQAVDDQLVPLATTEEAPSAAPVTADDDHPAARAWQANNVVGDDAHLHLPLGAHGVLSVEHAPNGPPPVRRLDTLAAHATTMLDRVATAAAQRRAHERCEALRAAGRALLDAAPGAAGAEAAFDALAPVLPDGVRCRLLALRTGAADATVRAANAAPLEGLEEGDTWAVGAGLQRLPDEALYAVDDLDAAASTALERHLAEAGLGSLVAVPIADDGGRRGILLLAAPPPAAFAPHHRAVAREAADLLGQALDPPGADEQDDETDDALRSALLANVHHELRTPLTSIIGFAEVLCQKEEGAAGRFADLIARSGRRLETTFDNLLTLSRLEAGTMPIEPEPLSVAAEGRAVVAAFEERAREAEVALEWNGPEGALDAVLDADGLRDVLRHLLDNAVAFTEAGGTVTVRLGAAGDEVVLAVADTGIGMDPARVSELTVPFRQASTGLDRTHEGCGLGLSIVQGWVTALAGTVDVETALGAGTTVTVRLPRAPAAGGP